MEISKDATVQDMKTQILTLSTVRYSGRRERGREREREGGGEREGNRERKRGGGEGEEKEE